MYARTVLINITACVRCCNMMAFLHYMFSSVQLIAEQEFEHLEKIKTIGSSYMVASGLGEGCPVREKQPRQQL